MLRRRYMGYVESATSSLGLAEAAVADEDWLLAFEFAIEAVKALEAAQNVVADSELSNGDADDLAIRDLAELETTLNKSVINPIRDALALCAE